MAQLIIEIPDANAADVRDTLCEIWKGPNGGSSNAVKMAFMKAYIARWMKDQYREGKVNQAANIAMNTASGTANQVDIT